MKEYIFNENGVCTNPDEETLAEGEGFQAIGEFAKLPNGLWSTGRLFRLNPGFMECKGVWLRCDHVFDTKKKARQYLINRAREFFTPSYYQMNNERALTRRMEKARAQLLSAENPQLELFS